MSQAATRQENVSSNSHSCDTTAGRMRIAPRASAGNGEAVIAEPVGSIARDAPDPAGWIGAGRDASVGYPAGQTAALRQSRPLPNHNGCVTPARFPPAPGD